MRLSLMLSVALMLLAAACTQNQQQRPTVSAQRPPESANAALQALDDGLYDEAAPAGSARRRTMEIAWAVLPGIALVAVFVLTWRVMHGMHVPALSPGATQ